MVGAGLETDTDAPTQMADVLTRELLEEEEEAERQAKAKEAKRLAKLERKRCVLLLPLVHVRC
jgi:hypothetical protein